MSMWEFLSDPDSQQTLAFYGGGAVVVVSGLWAAFLALRKKPKSPSPPAVASGDGVAAGGDVLIEGGLTIQKTQVPKLPVGLIVVGLAMLAYGFFATGDTDCSVGTIIVDGDIDARDITLNADGADVDC